MPKSPWYCLLRKIISYNASEVGKSIESMIRSGRLATLSGLNFLQVLKPSEDLEKLFVEWMFGGGVRSCTINAICEEYSLDKKHVLKFKDSL
ncbi:hypothetical protein MA16_Dca006708 [Dendrobium catenatum]|uniref:Uncharacterized protein n=1 Tax=Dendrobium catenatum TaxID=906689 RepID=A0A2I0W8Y4_9ASPA|nr:hypothetical protein MA16_Dca006708 [Dendrobium catenatum]